MKRRIIEEWPLQATAQTPWRHVLPGLVVVLCAVLWLYRDTALAMVAIWARSETFAHAYAVPPLVAWLVWRQRRALAEAGARPQGRWLLPLLAMGVLWLLGELAAANAAAQFAFTALLVLAAVALIGSTAARTILFPLGFLFFAVPVGEFMMPQLMVWTADFTVQALRLSGVPVYREGLQFVIPSGHWSVVEACSGVRYLIASFMVGVLFAYLNYRSPWRRWAFAAVAVVVPVAANWVRAYLIVMLGHHSGNTLAVGADHLIYGWAFFALVIVSMFLIGARWSQAPEAVPAGPMLPNAGSARTREHATWRRTAATTAAVLALVALPHLVLSAIQRGEVGAQPVLQAPAALAPGWQRVDSPTVAWKPAFQNPAAELQARYAGASGEVGLYIGYYRQQTYARKLVSSDNVLVPSRDPVWAQVAEGRRAVADSAGRSVTWRSARLNSALAADPAVPQRLRVRQLYWVNGHLTASDSQAKVLGALYRLLGRGDDAAVIVLFTASPTATSAAAPASAQDSADNAEAVLDAFARANLPAIEALLQRTRNTAQQPTERSQR